MTLRLTLVPDSVPESEEAVAYPLTIFEIKRMSNLAIETILCITMQYDTTTTQQKLLLCS